MLVNSVCMYEYVTNTMCLWKLLFVKSVYINAGNGNAIMPATRATAKQIHPSLQCSVRITFFNNSTRWLAGQLAIYHVGLSLLLMAGMFEFLCILFNNFSQVVHSKIHELSSSCKVKYYLKTLMDQAGVEHNVFTSFKPCFLIILLYLSTYVCNCNTTFKYTLPAMLSLFKTLLSIQVYLCQV